MEWINYQHLYYFWMVANEGTVVQAAKRLRLAQPTVSAQLRTLEDSLGVALFEKAGRGLRLTDTGQVVFSYADEIFYLGSELLNVLSGRSAEAPAELKVGIADILPKLAVCSILRPALELDEKIKILAFDGKPNELLAKLSIHGLDLVLTDTPISPEVAVKAYNHLLGESTIAIYGASSIAAKYRRDFPKSLNHAPMLLPTKTTTLRRSIDLWFEEQEIYPDIVGEYEDSALLKVFGQEGAGLFPLPTIIEKDAMRQYRIKRVGDIENVKERFYAISLERKIHHPGVLAITSAARESLFERNR